MKEIKEGITIFDKTIIGKAFLGGMLSRKSATIKRQLTEENDIEVEFKKFEKSVEKSLQIIDDLILQTEDEGIEILETHKFIISDPEISTKIWKGLNSLFCNIEFIIKKIYQESIDIFKSMDDEYFQERAKDIEEVYNLILNNLYDQEEEQDKTIPAIYVGKDISTYDLISSKDTLKGIILQYGGKTSHIAILCSAFGIPSIFGVSNISSIPYDSNIILDTKNTKIIVNPSQEVLNKYKEIIEKRELREQIEKEIVYLDPITKDGHYIEIKMNMEILSEIENFDIRMIDGIGLFRTEFLFISREIMPKEEEQFQVYKKILKILENKPVTIRTLDIGGDKIAYANESIVDKEKNPILGLRGIRYCLFDIQIFKTQLRALIRASVYGNLRIMFPMVSGVEQFRIVRAIIEDIYFEFEKNKIPYKRLPLGITLEVPSAVMMADALAEFVDFFSIGTNDLIQYTIGVDRGNENVANLYERYHPAVLRLIKSAIDNAHSKNIKIGVCGQMAGDPRSAVILTGFGIDELSMSPFAIAKVKHVIRSFSLSECKEFSKKILSLNTANSIKGLIKREIDPKFPEFFV